MGLNLKGCVILMMSGLSVNEKRDLSLFIIGATESHRLTDKPWSEAACLGTWTLGGNSLNMYDADTEVNFCFKET